MNDKAESNDCPEVIKKANPWIKLAAGIFTLILLVGGVIWGMDETYSRKKAVEEKFLLAEQQTVKTFNQVQQQFEKFDKRQDIKFYSRELEKLNEQHIAITKKVAINPNDPILKEELERIVRNKAAVQQKYDKLME